MIREFLFIDEGRIDSYLAQSAGRGMPGLKAGLMLPPFSLGIEAPGKGQVSSAPAERRLQKLMLILKRENLVSAARPPFEGYHLQSFYNDPLFVHEFIDVTRILLKIDNAGAPSALTVWIAEPDITADELKSVSYPQDEELAVMHPIFDVSFLYLIQEHWPAGDREQFMSGRTALAYVADVARGNLAAASSDEALGIYDLAHPIEKLARIGGVNLGKRRIETLYRVRYLSNEQTFAYQNKTIMRVHDLVGYPLFIAALDG